MDSTNITCKKCGIRIHPPALILTYSLNPSAKTRRRTMPLRCFNNKSKINTIAEELRNNPRHQKYINCIPRYQLEHLLTILKDTLLGYTVEESLQRIKQKNITHSQEDLNKLDDVSLSKKKAVMEQSFLKNQKKSTDPDFIYDFQVDFNESSNEKCEWDSDVDLEL